MKIIDEQGRLFGKINLIDFLVMLFLFSLIPIFYLGYTILTKKPLELNERKEYVFIEIPCNLIKISPETLKLIKVGDKAIDKEHIPAGEITWIGGSRPYIHKFYIDNADKDHPLLVENKALRDLSVRLTLRAEIKADSLYYNNKQILVGSSLDFKTDKYKVEAIPLMISGIQEQ